MAGTLVAILGQEVILVMKIQETKVVDTSNP